MESYLLYVMITAATVASPGPGVLLTLTNTLRYGFVGSFAGILGIAVGIFALAMVTASSLALVLSNSVIAFNLLKYLGAGYLIYLGFKLWRSHKRFDTSIIVKPKKQAVRFIEGFTITVLNPKAIFFFIALFPQFINLHEALTSQFLLLVLTYCVLVVVIHLLYAASAKAVKSKLTTEQGSILVSKVSGSFHILFGLGILLANSPHS